MTPDEIMELRARAHLDNGGGWSGSAAKFAITRCLDEIERLQREMSDMEDELTVWRANCEWPD